MVEILYFLDENKHVLLKDRSFQEIEDYLIHFESTNKNILCENNNINIIMKTKILSLCLLGVGLFSSCSLSDPGNNKTISGDGNMRIGVSLPSATSRVVETADASKGLITTWESTDSLRVFNKYTKNGSQGSMQGFKFVATGSGSNTTFAYSGAEGYSFTPGSSLYAFNALPTAGNYTKTYNSATDNFTLSLSGLASQDGTVGNLKNYDAMYAVSSVGSDGSPSAMSMNHLMSVIRFDLTNADFTSTLTSVTLACGSSNASILPSSGSFTMSNVGVVANGTFGGVTNWQVNNIAVSSGKASVYLITFPFQNLNGYLAIAATTSNGSIYSRQITLSNFSLTPGQLKAYTATLNKEVANVDHNPSVENNYYGWDASSEGWTTDENGSYYIPYNGGSVATNSCKNCPTYNQIQMYLAAGIYWDTSKHGAWFKKRARIPGFYNGSANKVTWIAPVVVSSFTNTIDYFFLPARGNESWNGEMWGIDHGYYWSSTPSSSDGGMAYRLVIDINSGHTELDNRGSCYAIW